MREKLEEANQKRWMDGWLVVYEPVFAGLEVIVVLVLDDNADDEVNYYVWNEQRNKRPNERGTTEIKHWLRCELTTE